MKNKIGFCLTLCFLTPVFTPSILHSQAIRQLELLTGQTIDRGRSSGYYEGSVPAPSSMPGMEFYDGEFGSFLDEQAFKENQKGAKYYNNRKWSKAVSHFKKALKLNPENTSYVAHMEYAKAQVEKEKVKKPVNPNEKTDAIFLANINKDIATYKTQLEVLRKPLASYIPPLPPAGTPRRVVEDGLMFGLYNTEFDFWANAQRPENPFSSDSKLLNPFTKKPFKEGEYFAGTDKVSNWELLRGFMDNISLGRYTLNTQYGKELVGRLHGTHFTRLIAHSNGATLSEALIRENVITVDELNIMGGDRSLMNFSGYDELVRSGKVKKIVVWVNPGDIIPGGTSSNLLAAKVDENGKYQNNFTAFFDYKLTGKGNTNPNVEYRFLKGPVYQKGQKMEFNSKAFDAHDLSAYFENVGKYPVEKRRSM